MKLASHDSNIVALHLPKGDYAEFAELQESLEEHNRFAKDVMMWQRRMRMGGQRPGGGQAFCKWWKKYGETHPEYFALNKFGKREPVSLGNASRTEQFVKICASNPGVADQIIADWRPRARTRRFALDTKDVGLKEKWQDRTWSQTESWDRLRTDRFWERQFAFDEKVTLSKAVADVIKRYDGIGWYATRIEIPPNWRNRKIYLCFGAVDESCWVWLNGKKAGEHLYKLKNDWKTPFEIRIDKLVDWSEKKQLVMVRVEDKGGVGGIWRPVWLVSKK